MALLVGILVLRSRVRERPWPAVAIAPPAGLLHFRVATPDKHPDGVLGILGDVIVAANLVALPVTAWVIGRLLAPHYFEVRERRLRIATSA